MRFSATLVALVSAGLVAAQSSDDQCYATCTAIQQTFAQCQANGASASSIISCSCTSDKLAELQKCADCAATDSAVPANALQAIQTGIAQVNEACAGVSGLTSVTAAASGSASATSAASSAASDISSAVSDASSAVSDAMSSATDAASSAGASASSTPASSGAQQVLAGGLSLAGAVAALIMV